MNRSDEKQVPLMVQALRKQKTARVPVWLMRQAGRYLPEYRALREQAGGFLELVYNPDNAAEVTVQPVRRFGMDGAILFSDILVIPQALGQTLTFGAGEGPRLAPVITPDTVDILDPQIIDQTLNPVYETVKRTRAMLDLEGCGDTALIGFAGAPWTVACYMVEGRGSKDYAGTLAFAREHRRDFTGLIEMVTQATIHYLGKQIEAGAQIVQLFDSWAGVMDRDLFDQFSISPTAAIVSALKRDYPDIPVIGFPRGVPLDFLSAYARQTGVDGLGCDQGHDPRDLAALQEFVCVQGNLDPEILRAGGAAMEPAVRRIMEALSDGPFIFNLGHGVIKETDPSCVDRLVRMVQEYPL